MKNKLLSSLIVFATLTACGGGGGGGTAPAPPASPAPPAPVPTNAGGIWEGTSNTSGLILNFAGVVTENGEGRFFDDNGTQYIVSNISGNDGSVTLNFTAVAQFGFVFLDGSTVTTGSLTGTVIEQTSFTGNFSVATGESGTISLTYNPIYERDSSFSKLEGLWDENGFGILSFNADGSFFEQDTFGCVFDGQASIIDPAFNVYSLNMTVSLCGAGVDGQYTGLGVLTDFASTDDTFILQMNDDDLIFTTSLFRM